MKKITDNSIFNKISIALNAGILILFIISMVLLLGFDKVNVEYVHYQRTHDKANEELRTAQQPTRGDSIRLANYKYRLDTLLVKEMPTDKNAAKALTETIERISNNVDEHTKIKHSNDSVVAVKAAIYEPIKEKYDSLAEEAGSKKNTFKWVFTFTLILLVAKIFIFAFWNYKSAINNRIAADWTKKSSKPYWAFLGWIIPAYNFIKPYSFLSEICDDTEYIIENHDAKERNPKKSSDQELLRGIWWGMFLIAVVLILIFINNTFFNTGALFLKLNHTNVAIMSAVIWGIYLLFDTIVCLNFNNLGKKLYNSGK